MSKKEAGTTIVAAGLPPELKKIISTMGGGAKAATVIDIEEFFGARELTMDEKKEYETLLEKKQVIRIIEEIPYYIPTDSRDLKEDDMKEFFDNLSLAELRVAAKYLYKTRKK